MKKTRGEKIFGIFNICLLLLVAFVCLAPILNTFAVSLSSKAAVARNEVVFWPIDINFKAYKFLLGRQRFWDASLITVWRVLVGVPINMFLIITCAYPLSKSPQKFRSQRIYLWFFVFTMLFSGGMIPQFILVSELGLMDTVWSLVLPRALPVFSMILMLNFFRAIPGELEEAALIDGASHFKTLWQIFVPCALPAIATLSLFSIVQQWNEWFDGIIYSRKLESYPLQSYLQTVIVSLRINQDILDPNEYKMLNDLSDRTVRTAQIVIAILPIACVYPILQKYFVTGIVVGSVKG